MIYSLLNFSNDAITTILTIIAFLIAIVFSVVLHEIGHGYAAYLNGDDTAKVNGRLSLNPVVHFDPIGFLMLLFMGFGYAKPVPVNPYKFNKPKRGMLMVSLAGVFVNFILAIFFIFIFTLLLFLQINVITSTSSFIIYLMDFLFSLSQFMVIINISLMLFNLLPFGPLDGLKVLEAIFRRGNRVTEFLRTYGMYILLGLFGLSMISNYFSSAVSMFEYVDLLGMYITTCRHYIAGGIMSLFALLFGFDPMIGFIFF